MPKESDGSQVSDQSQNEILQQAIAARLGDCGHPGLRRVHVIVDNQRVVLSGTVSSYYMKQMAQETARQACPTRKVYNDLDVAPAQN